jgi:streptogramin lyase
MTLSRFFELRNTARAQSYRARIRPEEGGAGVLTGLDRRRRMRAGAFGRVVVVMAMATAAAALVAEGGAPDPVGASSYRIVSMVEPGSAGNTHPVKLATGADGRVWFTESYVGASQIGSISPSGDVRHYPLESLTTASEITLGPDGNIWTPIDGHIAWTTPAGLTTFCHCLPVYSGPPGTATGLLALTTAPDGKLWYTRGTLVGRITPGVPMPQFEEFPTSLTSAQLVGIAAGPDGAVWFVDAQQGTLGRVTPEGAVTLFPAPLLQGATDLVRGPDGNLWFSGAAGVGRVGLDGAVTLVPGTEGDDPEAIAVSPAGDVWATGSDALLQIGPTGTVTRHRGDVIDHGPDDIAAGPDGYMWFTADDQDRLGKISWEPDPSGEFTGVTPARVLDTRSGLGQGGVPGPVGTGQTLSAQISGRGGVPASGVSAVVMNVTAVDPTAASYLTVWPSGTDRPDISNLNFVPRQTVPNLVTVGVGPNGKVNAFNSSGATHLLFDVVGYYADRYGPSGALFRSLSPARLFDTRSGLGGVPAAPVGPGGVLHVDVTGAGGVPPREVTGVVMNVTVTAPSYGGWLTVYPDDAGLPASSNLNFVAGQTVANLVTVRVPGDGVVAFQNAAGTTHVLADLVGYYVDADSAPSGEGRFVPVRPTRVLDTRPDDALQPGEVLAQPIAGWADGVPASAGAVALNATVTLPWGDGWLTVFPDDECAVPDASNVNFSAAQTVPNMVISRLSDDGGCGLGPGLVDVFTTTRTHVILDVFGYFTR